MRKRHYILFVSRDENGQLRKVPIPLHYAYIFLAAAVVGAFTITGMAGSYSRMLMKTASFNQVRSQREALRKDYLQMEKVAREKDVQAASLGSLASEVSALYGLRQNKFASTKSAAVLASAPAIPAGTSNLSDDAFRQSVGQLSSLLSTGLSGRMTRVIETTSGPSRASALAWAGLADAPDLWPIIGRVTSSFGERLDPFNGEGAFHAGIDIASDYGQPIHAPADGIVEVAGPANGYGREIIIDHGYGLTTLYGHLSGFAVTAGEEVRRGEIIGFVGSSGRSTGPHLHYEVRIRNTPVNPHKYLRDTLEQFASSQASNTAINSAVGGGS